MYKKQGYMGGGYGTNISPMDMKNKDMMDQQMRTPKMMGGKTTSGSKTSIADMEKACSAMAGKNASMRY
jgi:hypothetical protein|tara:strand:+ start:411 stop:617 length:207 start_codon:yes stop_codon:yes gene_type:complete